jgi:hypothetical protein
MRKKLIFGSFSLVAAILIGWVFWQQELKYTRPTPRPADFHDVPIGSNVDLTFAALSAGKPTLLHFFSPDCPCSRFNMSQFESMSRKYAHKVNVLVVLQADDDDAVDDFKEKYELNLPVVLDKDGKISERCGIYSTPQAVILNSANVLYFKGNYNKSRFCTRKETSYAQIALDSLIAGKSLPLFLQNEVTLPYGCELPSDETPTSFMSLFK